MAVPPRVPIDPANRMTDSATAQRTVDVTRTYLRMLRATALKPVEIADPRLTFGRIEECDVARARAFYRSIGDRWHWHDRNRWSDAEYTNYLARPGLSLWVLRFGDDDAGYVEIERHGDGSVEIALFGLMSRYFGRGFGKHLLTCAVRAAWSMGPHTVWLHTCTLDSPHALPNYLKRGFVAYREERYTTTLA